MLVAWHYPRPEHRDDMVRRVRDATGIFRLTPGCLDAEVWVDDDSGAIVVTARFFTDDTIRRAFAAIDASDVDYDFDDRELLPREIVRLTPLTRAEWHPTVHTRKAG